MCSVEMRKIRIWWTIFPVLIWRIPDSKVHGANMGPILGRQDPGRPHVGPMNFAIWDMLSVYFSGNMFEISFTMFPKIQNINTSWPVKLSGCNFSIGKSYFQYRNNSHHRDKIILWLSYLHISSPRLIINWSWKNIFQWSFIWKSKVHSEKLIWKYCLQNCIHFVSASIC